VEKTLSQVAEGLQSGYGVEMQFTLEEVADDHACAILRYPLAQKGGKMVVEHWVLRHVGSQLYCVVYRTSEACADIMIPIFRISAAMIVVDEQ
jgi:hypothetical protein